MAHMKERLKYDQNKRIQYACILLYLEWARTLVHAHKRESA